MTPECYENGRLYVKTFPETGKKLIFPTIHDSFAATKIFCCFLSLKVLTQSLSDLNRKLTRNFLVSETGVPKFKSLIIVMKSANEKKRKTKKAAIRVVHGLQQFKPNRFRKFDRYQLQPPSFLVVNTNRKCRKKSFSFSLPETTTGMTTNADTCFFSISGNSVVTSQKHENKLQKKNGA